MEEQGHAHVDAVRYTQAQAPGCLTEAVILQRDGWVRGPLGEVALVDCVALVQLLRCAEAGPD